MVILFNVVSSLSLSLVYFYIYREYREKYMGIWGISWLLFSFRIILDLFRYQGYDSPVLIFINQISSVGSTLLLLLGTYTFSGRKMPKGWYYGALAVTVATDLMVLHKFSLSVAAFPTATYFGLVNICAGLMFLRLWGTNGWGRYITGYALILIGFLNLTYPFSANGTNQFSTTLFFVVGFILWETTLVGILLVYFEKVRTELSMSERRFRLLAENARDIIYRIRIYPKLFVEYISPAVQTIAGYSPQEFYANPELLFSLIDASHHHEFIQICSGKVKVSEHLKILLLRAKNGEEIYGEEQLVPIYDRDGRLVALEGIIRDIRERKKVEAEMARLDQLRLLGETAAGIAHEIRNPMTTVRGYLQLFSQRPNLQSYDNQFQLMITELDRANSIITDFLSLSKEQTTRLTLHNLNDIICALLPILQTNALFASQEVQVSLGDIPSILMDERQMRQLILNLVQNGIEAMEPGGVVEISTICLEGKVLLKIKDQGPGIEPTILEKLGTPFFTTKDNGTGLGLTVCYCIAARHQAEITIHTEGIGTTFQVAFPQDSVINT